MSLFDVISALLSDCMYQTAASRAREGVTVKLVRKGQVLVFDWAEATAMEVYFEPGAYFYATYHPLQRFGGVEYPMDSLAAEDAKERGFRLFAKPGIYIGGLGKSRLPRPFDEQEVSLADLPDAPPEFVVTGFEPYELEES